MVADHVNPLADAHQVVRGGFAFPATGQAEMHVIRLRGLPFRRLIHHQVATSPLHLQLVVLHRVEQAHQLVARLPPGE